MKSIGRHKMTTVSVTPGIETVNSRTGVPSVRRDFAVDDRERADERARRGGEPSVEGRFRDLFDDGKREGGEQKEADAQGDDVGDRQPRMQRGGSLQRAQHDPNL